MSRLLPGYDDQIDVVKIPPEEGNDVFELVGYESAWTEQTDPGAEDYGTTPSGDAVAISAELFEEYALP